MPGRERDIIEQAGFLIGAQLPKGGTTGQILEKNSSADFDASWQTGAGPSPAQIVTVVASPADLIAMPLVPLHAVPAPGVGFFWRVSSMVAILKFSTTPYVLTDPGADAAFIPTEGDSNFDSNLELAGFIDQSQDTIQDSICILSSAGFDGMENQPVQININDPLASVVGGDSPVTFILFVTKLPVPI